MRHYLRHLDHLMLATAVAISAFGLWIIENATANDIPGNPRYYFNRELAYVVVGTAGMLILAAIPPSVFRRYQWWLYGFVLATTAAVLAVGSTVQGGQRWINLGAFQFQPSEFGKLLLILGLSGLLVRYRGSVSENKLTLMALGYMAVPALLVFLEPDFGTALVYSAITLGILFVHGAPWRHFVWLGLAGVVVLALVFSVLPAAGVQVLQPYQKDRLTSFLEPSADPADAGYQQQQAKIAVGSGEKTGRGVDNATQTGLDFLPEHHTDFIFAVVGETYGFAGCALVLSLYALLIWRALHILTIAKNLYGALLAGGITVMLLFQLFVNVGMNVGIMPITGVTAPLLSAGGSSMLATFLAIGLLQSVNAQARETAAVKGRATVFE
jgi:rod shape determining protein RodA